MCSGRAAGRPSSGLRGGVRAVAPPLSWPSWPLLKPAVSQALRAAPPSGLRGRAGTILCRPSFLRAAGPLQVIDRAHPSTAHASRECSSWPCAVHSSPPSPVPHVGVPRGARRRFPFARAALPGAPVRACAKGCRRWRRPCPGLAGLFSCLLSFRPSVPPLPPGFEGGLARFFCRPSFPAGSRAISGDRSGSPLYRRCQP